MKKVLTHALIIGCLSGIASASEFDIGISGSERGISGFSLSIGDYYRVPARDIMVVERHIPSDEIGVVYFLSERSHRHPQYITDMRLRGMSWWDISIHLGLDPHNLYVVNTHTYSHPPYGKAYGYHDRGRKYRLQDAEIIDLVNVRFLSSYYHVSPDEIIERRNRGQRYIHIDDDYRSQRYNRQHNQERYEYKERKEKHYKNNDRGHGNKHREER